MTCISSLLIYSINKKVTYLHLLEYAEMRKGARNVKTDEVNGCLLVTRVAGHVLLAGHAATLTQTHQLLNGPDMKCTQ